MMGLSSIMAHLMAFCNVMFSGRRYPTEGTEGGVEEEEEAGVEEVGDFMEEERRRRREEVEGATLAAMGLLDGGVVTLCRS